VTKNVHVEFGAYFLDSGVILHGFSRILVRERLFGLGIDPKVSGILTFGCLKTIKNSLLDTLSGQNWSVLSAGVRKTVVHNRVRLWF
jgi:hypothetical protein